MLVSRFAIKNTLTDSYLVCHGFSDEWSPSIIDARKWETKPEHLIQYFDHVKIVLVTIECKEQPWEVKV